MCESCGAEGHGHGHGHGHSHEEGHGHGHGHGQGQGHSHAVRLRFGGGERRLLSANAGTAQRLREDLSRRGILMVNFTSAPGSGKTALLKATLSCLERGTAAVLVGDLETDRDAARLRGLGFQVRQINTGKGCHLSAAQVAAALEDMDLEGLEYLFVENVGNMACPAEYDLGEHIRVALLSLPEGDDKVAKYPGLFAAADAVVLNKVDLARVLPFNEELLRRDLGQVNTHAALLPLSALGGQGISAWLEWLAVCRSEALAANRKSAQARPG